MPRGDRTGPAGLGPMTGRAAGYCAGYPVAGFMNDPGWGGAYGGGRGWGRGGGGWGRGGGGWGHRHWYYATGLPGWQRAAGSWPGYPAAFPAPFGPIMTKEQELEALRKQGEYLEQALDELRNRISQIDSAPEDSKST
jgi:hypothetical protein